MIEAPGKKKSWKSWVLSFFPKQVTGLRDLDEVETGTLQGPRAVETDVYKRLQETLQTKENSLGIPMVTEGLFWSILFKWNPGSSLVDSGPINAFSSKVYLLVGRHKFSNTS